MWHLKKIVRFVFSRCAIPKGKIGLPNLDFNEFFCRKRLLHCEKHVKRCLYNEFEENDYSCFWDNHYRSHFRVAISHFRFLDFRENLEILSIHLSITMWKNGCFYLYYFWRYKAINTHIYIYAHTQRSISKNHFFGLRRPHNI